MFLRRLAKHTILYGLSSVLTRLLNWLLTPLYVNLFNPQQFGIVSELYALLFFPYTFLMFGMETTFFRHTHTPIEARKSFSTTFFIVSLHTFLFAILFWACFDWIVQYLGYENSPVLLTYVALILILDCLNSLPMAYLRYQERSFRYAMITLITILVNLLLNLYFVLYLRKGIEYIFLSNVIASFLKLVLSLSSILPLRFEVEIGLFPRFYQYGVFIMLAGILGAINELLDRILLPRLWEDGTVFDGVPRTAYEMNGIYSANYKLAMLITLFFQAYRYASEPIFFKEKAHREHNIASGYYYFVVLGGLVCAVISLLRYEIGTFPFLGHIRLIPKPYESGLESVPILLWANLAFGSYVYFSIWYKLQDKTIYGFVFGLVGALLTLVINLYGIPKWGFYACAWATLIAYSSMALLCYLYGKRNSAIVYPMKKLLPYLFFLLVLTFLGEMKGWWRWASLGGTIVLGYVYFQKGLKDASRN